MAESHLTILSCLPLAHIKLILSWLIIQQLRSRICCKRALSRSCVPPSIPFHSFISSESIVMLLSSLIILYCEDRVLSCAYHLTGVLCPLVKFFSPYQVLHLFSTGVLSEFVLLRSSFLTEIVNFVYLHRILFSKWFNFSRFFGLMHLSNKQLSFTSSLPFPFPPVPF